MGDNRDLNKKLPSFEREDDSGLELSLGLAYGKFINKAKCNGNDKEHNSNEKKLEKIDKTCLENTSLKECQGSIGEKLGDGKEQANSLPRQQEIFWTSLQTNTSKNPDKLTKMHMNEVQFPGFGEAFCATETSELLNACPQKRLLNFAENNQVENLGVPANKSNTDTTLKDLQFSPHMVAAGQFIQTTLPTHFLDAFRNGHAIHGHAIGQSCANTTSVMENSFQLVGTQSPSPVKSSLQLDTIQGKQFLGTDNRNSDQHQRQSVAQQHWQDDILEQQKKKKREMTAQKGQEARKKRKLLIEEQKQQKKSRREDERAGPPGFRRPGSNTWVCGWEPPMLSVADMEMSKSTRDTEEGNQVPEIGSTFQQGGDRNTEETELVTDEESSESQQEESNISDNAFLSGVNVDEVCKSLSNTKEAEYLPKRSNKDPKEAERFMAVGTGGLHKTLEKEEQVCKTSISVGLEKTQCTTMANNSNPALANPPITTPMTKTSTALPYSVPSFPVMPAPYSLPLPVPTHPNVPFPVGYPFVYLMQYPPPGVDVSNCTAVRPPIYPNGFQLPLGYAAPFQLPTLEASPSWVPVLRPQHSPSFSPNFGGARTSSEHIEDETKVSQGVKSHDKQKNQVALSTDDTSKQTNGSTNEPDSSHNVQDHCAGPDHQVLSTFMTTSAILGPSQAHSGTGKTQFFTEHGRLSAVKGSHGSFAPRPATPETIEGCSISSPGQDETKLETRDLDNPNMIGFGMASQTIQKDGSGDVVARPNVINGFPQEMWNLMPGIACGMTFGGCGTTPDLPWVSTKGVGPNGKNICGVLYKYNASQVRIVCACHGNHMSPTEFVQHAGTGEASNQEKNIVVDPYVISSEKASAQG